MWAQKHGGSYPLVRRGWGEICRLINKKKGYSGSMCNGPRNSSRPNNNSQQRGSAGNQRSRQAVLETVWSFAGRSLHRVRCGGRPAGATMEAWGTAHSSDARAARPCLLPDQDNSLRGPT